MQAEDTDKEVACQVQRVLGSHPDDKVIVYCGRIADVERLAEAYGWDRFHSKVDSNQAKDRRLRQWIKTGQVMVATNALGVGLDVANIRAVIHHGAPRRLRDPIREGRAGRTGGGGDRGQEKRAAPAADKENAAEAKTRTDMERFLWGSGCRREMLDMVMDGSRQRDRCQEGEAACDRCAEQAAAEAALDEVDNSEELTQIRQQVVRQEERDRMEARERARAAAEKSGRLAEVLASWAGRCVMCRASGRSRQEHGLEECAEPLANKVLRLVQRARQAMQYAEYSACFDCGVPQALCESWVARDGVGDGDEHELDHVNDNGMLRRTGERRCQWGGIIMEATQAMLVAPWFRDVASSIVRDAQQQSNFEINGAATTEQAHKARWKWMGERVRFGSMGST